MRGAFLPRTRRRNIPRDGTLILDHPGRDLGACFEQETGISDFWPGAIHRSLVFGYFADYLFDEAPDALRAVFPSPPMDSSGFLQVVHSPVLVAVSLTSP